MEMQNKGQERAKDRLDLLLDSVLRQSANVEPRAGLEERVLANLRAEQNRRSNLNWWIWPAAAVLAVLLIVLTWHTTPRSYDTTAQTPDLKLDVAIRSGPVEMSGQPVRSLRTRARPKYVAVTQAKTDQFPSAQPITAQEKLLQSYFANDPVRAVLMARAMAEGMRRDAEEIKMQSQMNNEDSQQ